MIHPDSDATQKQIPLLDYLQQHGWKIVRDHGREEVAGLCPLHRETRPSFYVNRRKQVFYCHGCGRGGGLARLIRWLELAPESTPGWPADEPLLEQTYDFYQRQFAHSDDARAYLAWRGIHDRAVIDQMRIGYAPGGCLRGYLARLGYGRQTPRHLIPLPASLPSADPDVVDGTAVLDRLSTATRVLDLFRQHNPTVNDKPLQLLLRRLVRIRSRFQTLVSSTKTKK